MHANGLDFFDAKLGSVMGTKAHPDVGKRAKQLLLLFDYENGRQFALDAGIGYQSWNRIENGHQRVSNAIWPKIARKCPGVTLDWLNWGNEAGLSFSVHKRLSGLPDGNETAQPRRR